MPLLLCETDKCESCDCDDTANVNKFGTDVATLNQVDIFIVEVVKNQFFNET